MAKGKIRASEKPQDCNWCSQPATKSFLWAEGKAYIPACDAHHQKTIEHIEREYDKPDAVHTVRKSAATWYDADADYPKPQTRPHITRGLHLNPARGWHPDSVQRLGDGTAHPSDVLDHMSTTDVGHFWHGHDDALDDAKDFADADGDAHPVHEKPLPNGIHLGEVGVVLEGHRPQGWDPGRNRPHPGFTGNSHLPPGTTVHLHKIHYNDAQGAWHEVDATGHQVHVSPNHYPGVHLNHPPRTAAREPGSVKCWVCRGIGDEPLPEEGHECGACDGSGYMTPADQRRWTCPCGMQVTIDEHGEYAHRDGSVSHDKGDNVPKDEDGHYQGVSDVMRDRDAEDLARKRRIFGVLGFRPNRRIFGPTYGLDTRLFDGDHLKDAVRLDLMAKWHRFCAEQGLKQPDDWSIVYFAGSEASEWTSAERKGNNDFDVLVGVDAGKFEIFNPRADLGVGNEEVAHELTSRLRESDLPDPQYLLPGGDPHDPWDQTWFCNAASYRIADIKPYAAYDVTHDAWAVRPPHLPDWSVEKFPEGHALVEMGDAYDDLIKAIMRLPEPYKTQQGNALWEHLHSDRGRAFGPNGEGWYDPANVIEKWLDQEGTWKDLWELHHRAEEDPAMLLAPADWSNDPRNG